MVTTNNVGDVLLSLNKICVEQASMLKHYQSKAYATDQMQVAHEHLKGQLEDKSNEVENLQGQVLFLQVEILELEDSTLKEISDQTKQLVTNRSFLQFFEGWTTFLKDSLE